MYGKDTQMREVENIQKFNVRRVLLAQVVHVVPGFMYSARATEKSLRANRSF